MRFVEYKPHAFTNLPLIYYIVTKILLMYYVFLISKKFFSVVRISHCQVIFFCNNLVPNLVSAITLTDKLLKF
jgi:hypothetical protein